MAAHYFATSEQIPTHLHLACERTARGWRAGALIIQRIAAEGGDLSVDDPEDAWQTALALAGTLTDTELLDETVTPEQLLYRLFHGEDLSSERPRALAYGCRCSRAHLSGILAGFAEDDLAGMAEDGVITMTCEFCNLDFRFEKEDIRRPA